MIKDWNVREIKDLISRIGYHESDAGQTGYVTWKLKQELYEVLWHTEKVLKNCSNYGEEEKLFLKKHDQSEMLETLKNKG